MDASRWLCFLVMFVIADGAFSWFEQSYRRGYRGRTRRVFSYPRDWDIDWVASQRQVRGDWDPAGPVEPTSTGEPVPQYRYHYQADQGAQGTSGLRPRLVVLPKDKVDTRGVWHSQQRGSALVVPGSEVQVTPGKESKNKFYRGTVTSIITSGKSPKKRNNRNHRHRNKGSSRQQRWEYSQDDPRTPPGHAKVCARCPSDRAVLAKKGATTVIMEVPPIIPCHPWSSVEKVKQEIVAGPQPGTEVPEGSHKIVIRLYRHKRTITNCVTRYNVIVRKCPELELGPGVRADCEDGKSWGSVCNISCEPGYLLEGDHITECTDDLEWSGVMPQCLPSTSCPVPVSPDHGHLSCRTPHHQPVPARARGVVPDGTVCHFHCDIGYMVPPTQQGLTRVRCIGGSWDNDQDPTCVETNELKEEEAIPDISAKDAFRFDGKGCPQDFCKNKGKCILILRQPMCSCMSGFSGLTCEDQEVDMDPDESNSIT